MKRYDIAQIEYKIGYKFKNKSHLIQAFTHSSFTNEHNQLPYEKLEFLGDAIIGFVVAKELYKRYPHMNVGQLSKARAILVSGQALSRQVDDMEIIEYLQVGKGDIQHIAPNSISIKCDLFEAIAGAITVDNNYDINHCKQFIISKLSNEIDKIGCNEELDDAKTLLLEKCAQDGKLVEFECISNQDKAFEVRLKINDRYVSRGKGTTKKEAEKLAAKVFLDKQN